MIGAITKTVPKNANGTNYLLSQQCYIGTRILHSTEFIENYVMQREKNYFSLNKIPIYRLDKALGSDKSFGPKTKVVVF